MKSSDRFPPHRSCTSTAHIQSSTVPQKEVNAVILAAGSGPRTVLTKACKITPPSSLPWGKRLNSARPSELIPNSVKNRPRQNMTDSAQSRFTMGPPAATAISRP